MRLIRRFDTACALAALALLVPALEPCAAAEDEGLNVYYSANALYNQGLHQLAVGEYKTFLQKYPTHAKVKQAHYGLALSYFSLGKYAEAEPEIKKVLSYGSLGDHDELNVMLGQCQLQLSKAAEAEKVFYAASTNNNPQVKVALAGLSEARFRLKQWKEAADSADRLIKMNPDKTTLLRALYQRGYSLHQLKKYGEAAPVLQQLLGLVDDAELKQQVAFILAECFRETDKLAEAEKNYVMAEGLKGVENEVMYRLGFVRFLQDNFDGAIDALQKSLAIKEDSTFADDAREYIARAFIAKQEPAKAVAVLEGDDPAKEPGDSASLWLARAYTKQNEYAKAIEVLKSAITRFPSSDIIREMKFDEANAMIASGDFKNAAPLLAPLAADANWGQKDDALRLYAGCLHNNGDYKGSLATTDKFLASVKGSPFEADMLFLRAENLYLSDQWDEALAAYDKFIAGYKDHANVPAATLRKAQVQYRKGQWAKALELAAPLAKDKPAGEAFSDINYLIGDCLFRLGKNAEAVAALEKFLTEVPKDDPRVSTALAEIGVASVRLKNEEKAKACFEKIIAEHPKSSHVAVASVELGRIRYEAGDLLGAKGALSLCLKAPDAAEQKPRAEYYLGWVALKEGDDAEAMKHFDTVLKSYPENKLAAESALQMGLLQLAAKDYKTAATTLSAFLTKNPKHKEVLAATYSLGIAQSRAGNPQAAAGLFKTVLAKYPDSDYADRSLYELAWCYKELKKNAEAIQQYELLLKNHAGSALAARAGVELAELKFEAKDYDEVITQLEAALNGMTDKQLREQALYRLGTAYFDKGAFDKSAEILDRMCTEYPESKLIPSAHFHAGESRLKLMETVAARAHFLAVTKMSPDDALMESALMRLAETQSLTKLWKESAATYASFLRKYPKSKWLENAMYGYAHALEKNKEYEKALAEYRKLLARKGKSELFVKSQFNVGECLFAMEKYDEAIKELVRVSVNYGDKEWAAKSFLEVGRILEAKGETEKAMDQFRKTVEKYPDHNVAVVAKQRLDALRRK